MENIQLLEKVMVRLGKQFNKPATFTTKVIDAKENIIEVSIFLHGESTSLHCSLDYLFNPEWGDLEDIRKINIVSDQLIEFFIKGMNEEEEFFAIDEVNQNLEFLYDLPTNAIRWVDVETNIPKVSFMYFNNEKDTKLIVTLPAEQLKREYTGRFDSENAPDILVDLSNIFQKAENESVEQAIAYTKNVVQRGIQASVEYEEPFLQFIEENSFWMY